MKVSAGIEPGALCGGTGRAPQCGRERASTRIREWKSIERETRQGAPGWTLRHFARTAVGAGRVRRRPAATPSRTTPALQKKIIPIGSYIITTEVLPDALARELSPRNRMIYDSKNYLYYYRLTPDNRMLFGGRAAFFPESGDTMRKSAEILRRGMIEVYPAAARHESRVRLGRDAGFRVRHHATRRADGRHVLRARICGARRRDGHIPGAVDGAANCWREVRRIRLMGFHFPERRWACTTASRGSCRSRGRSTSFWTG